MHITDSYLTDKQRFLCNSLYIYLHVDISIIRQIYIKILNHQILNTFFNFLVIPNIINIMERQFDITIPKSLRDITVSDWQKYVEVEAKYKDEDGNVTDKDELVLSMVQVFCKIGLKDLYSVPVSSFDNLIIHIHELFAENKSRVNQFTLKGTDGVEVTFGLIPNLDKMSYGEWEDLESYIFDDSKLHRAMAVLYRPLAVGKGKDSYLIHPYKGTEEFAEVMKHAPLDAALSARDFFFRLAIKLGSSTLDSTLQELITQKAQDLDNHLVKNGEAIKQYTS